jgi:PPOX class probable F420-dependent enzyme
MARTIAEDRRVDRAEMLRFVRPRHHGILATTRRDGTPQMSPVTMGLDDANRIVVSTYPERAKAHNVRHNAAVSMCVLSDDFGGKWIQVYGRAEVLDLPDALEPFVEYYRNIAGEHPDWDEYRQAMVDQGKVLVRMEIETWGPISRGGFPARLVTGE